MDNCSIPEQIIALLSMHLVEGQSQALPNQSSRYIVQRPIQGVCLPYRVSVMESEMMRVMIKIAVSVDGGRDGEHHGDNGWLVISTEDG